jgi:iron(III) transport system permease protein
MLDAVARTTAFFGGTARLVDIRRLPKDTILLAVGAIVVLAVCLMLVQIGVLVVSAFGGDSLRNLQSINLDGFRAVFAHPQFWQVMLNTVILGAGSVAVMLAIAVPCAWLYTRTDLPRKDALIALMTVNIAIPSFLVALGYIFLFNPSNGLGNEFARLIFGTTFTPFNVYTLGWMAALQGAALASPSFFMIVPTFEAIDVALEEAAAASGVGKSTAALWIIIPLAAPAIIATATYYFIIAVEIFDYAGMLGLPVRTFVISTWLYYFVFPGDGLPQFGAAAALGMMSAAAAAVLAMVYLWSTRRAQRYVVVTGKRKLQNVATLSRGGKIIAWSFVLLFATFSLFLPLLMLLWTSVLPYLQLPTMGALHSMNLSAYYEAFRQLPSLLKNNIIVMLAVPTISVIFASCIAWISVRTKLAGRKSLDVIVMISIAVPSIVGALAFLYLGLAIYHWLPIYTTIWIIVLAMATRYTTWGNRTLASAMMQVHPEIEEACSTSGVRRGPAFVLVLLPTIGRALLFSWFWIALLSLRELTIPLMLARNDTNVLSTAIWGLNGAGSANVAAALSVILLAMILIMVIAFHASSWRFRI